MVVNLLLILVCDLESLVIREEHLAEQDERAALRALQEEEFAAAAAEGAG